MHQIYVLKSLNSNHFYTGCTSDLKTRLNDHNKGKCSWTKKYGPWKLHYFENIVGKTEAFAREKYLKSHAGRNWIKKKLINMGL